MTPTSTNNWKVVQIDGVLTFRIPPDAEEQNLQAVDTVADVINGPGYEIMYEYGQFGRRIGHYKSQPGYTTRERIVDGQRAQEASFRVLSQNSKLPVVHMLQIMLDQGNTFTVRLSCVDDATCDIHNELFDSIIVK